jgi:Uma2 family endonuclease
MSSVPAHADSSFQLQGLILSPESPATTSVPIEAPPIHGIVVTPFDESADELIIPASALTYHGFREWALSDDFPARGRISFIGGELIVDMSPESLEEHSAVKSEIARVLLNLVRQRALGMVHIDGVLVSHPEVNLSNEPDILFISKETLRSGRLQLTPAKGRPTSTIEVVGAVDWVLEIVSPSSRRKDYELLRKTYFDAGIPEYWIVDALVDDDADVKFDVFVATEQGYASVIPVDGWHKSRVFNSSFKFSRERDENGFWEYTLHMQEKP